MRRATLRVRLVARGGHRRRDRRRRPPRPQRDRAAGDHEQRAGPHQIDQGEHVDLQPQVPAGRIEGILGDHEQVAAEAAEDHGPQSRAGLRIDIGVRRDQAHLTAAACHHEVGEEAPRALRPHVQRVAGEAQGVAGDLDRRAGPRGDVSAALDLVDVGAQQPDQDQDHPAVSHISGAASAAAGERAAQAGEQSLLTGGAPRAGHDRPDEGRGSQHADLQADQAKDARAPVAGGKQQRQGEDRDEQGTRSARHR